MKDPILADFIASIPPESTRYVELSADILDQVYAILEKKGMTQKQFAEELDKNESEVSKWLSGLHNLTLRSIVKMEIALGENILTTPQKAQEQPAKRSDFSVQWPHIQQEGPAPAGRYLPVPSISAVKGVDLIAA